MANKVQFIRVTDQERASVHYDIPIVEPRDILLRMELDSDGQPLNAVPVVLGGTHYQPTFTLKSSDTFAHILVDLWVTFAETAGLSQEKIISAKSRAKAMRLWAKER